MEPHVLDTARSTGWIEIVCGSMFSGKTEELIRRMRRARFARQHVEIFKPAMENRYAEDAVVSHDESILGSSAVATASQIVLLASDADVVGIDEAQFFGMDLVEVCEELAREGKRVIVAGLDQDYLGRPFEPMPQLMAIAEYVTKLHAICVVCGAPANHSQRLLAGDERVMLGARETYEPRCRECFRPHASPSEPTEPADRAGTARSDDADVHGNPVSQPPSLERNR